MALAETPRVYLSWILFSKNTQEFYLSMEFGLFRFVTLFVSLAHSDVR